MSVWKYVYAQRLAKQINATVPLTTWCGKWWDEESAETQMQMYIDEDPGYRLLNKSKTILIWILSVTLVFLYFYFGNYDPYFSTVEIHIFVNIVKFWI